MCQPDPCAPTLRPARCRRGINRWIARSVGVSVGGSMLGWSVGGTSIVPGSLSMCELVGEFPWRRAAASELLWDGRRLWNGLVEHGCRSTFLSPREVGRSNDWQMASQFGNLPVGQSLHTSATDTEIFARPVGQLVGRRLLHSSMQHPSRCQPLPSCRFFRTPPQPQPRPQARRCTGNALPSQLPPVVHFGLALRSPGLQRGWLNRGAPRKCSSFRRPLASARSAPTRRNAVAGGGPPRTEGAKARTCHFPDMWPRRRRPVTHDHCGPSMTRKRRLPARA